mmetsp:Transcript_47722/g.91199  ORF Transcript_47722/g.91199 Transcript_47722/m.91199 type:complete len:241 (-) Transcript_47722:533-1255(-)
MPLYFQLYPSIRRLRSHSVTKGNSCSTSLQSFPKHDKSWLGFAISVCSGERTNLAASPSNATCAVSMDCISGHTTTTSKRIPSCTSRSRSCAACCLPVADRRGSSVAWSGARSSRSLTSLLFSMLGPCSVSPWHATQTFLCTNRELWVDSTLFMSSPSNFSSSHFCLFLQAASKNSERPTTSSLDADTTGGGTTTALAPAPLGWNRAEESSEDCCTVGGRPASSASGPGAEGARLTKSSD